MRIHLVLFGVLLVSCNGIKDSLRSNTPYEEYQKSLKKSGLSETAMGTLWLEAGRRAFHDSVFVPLPHTESGAFRAEHPEARSFRMEVLAGQRLDISLQNTKQAGVKVFVDLFQWKKDEWKHLANADTSAFISVAFEKKATCLLRIQPELLTTVWYTIDLKVSPQLTNPVAGASNRSIGSPFGAPRNGGRRLHEGVDIFAARGSPVISPVKGRVTRVGEYGLGGKVVWVRDLQRGLLLYFAHLDRQLVNEGERVLPGDTIGLVGNTGNASTTSPHLHFGIYKRGAIDPLGYIRKINVPFSDVVADTAELARPYRVAVRKANLRHGPGISYDIAKELQHKTYLFVTGATTSWLRVRLPDNTEGYVHRSLAEKISEGISKNVDDKIAVLNQPERNGIPIANVFAPATIEILAHYENFQFIRTENEVLGWINTHSVR